ncbi:sel1 repeat family protein [Helicobacter pylori]|uniref:tetratricopeptide repeat protein n=1 Tax=Helicobacter pylori TaxID=210 RepID=UPI000D37FC97|nr:tetratricopeptide repeat protein [Helicobacter pylori]PUD18940.1 sel1 repeat family protein [Helicobacter pylori]QDY55605.1 sel1 repeat family protein [Helicobacter pylori]
MAEPNPKELFDLGVKSIEARDYIQAKKYFEKACDLKYGGGCFNLGRLYYYGEGVEKDFKKAFALFEKACDLNNSGGCGTLGMLYEFGQGVEKNLTKAAYFYSKACKLGFQKTCEILKELR